MKSLKTATTTSLSFNGSTGGKNLTYRMFRYFREADSFSLPFFDSKSLGLVVLKYSGCAKNYAEHRLEWTSRRPACSTHVP